MKLRAPILQTWLKAPCNLLILAGLTLTIAACGSSSSSDEPASTNNPDSTQPISFASVNDILKDHCGGALCHSAGPFPTAYVDDEATLRNNKDMVITRVITLGDMPPADATEAQKAMTNAQRNLIRDFLNQ